MSILDEMMLKLAALPPEQLAALTQRIGDAQRQQKKKWVPNPGPQTEAYLSEADEVFYGGSAGGGKSDLCIGLALNEHERTLYLREYLDDARAMAERMLEVVGSREGYNGQLLHYRTKERTVDFGGCRNDAEKQRYKGKPHDFIVFDEVSDFLESVYTFVTTWNRSTTPGQRCRIVAAGNPPTRPEGLWVIRRWAPWLDPRHPNPAKPGELRWFLRDKDDNDLEVDGRGPFLVDGKPTYARSRTFIRAKLEDNPYLTLTNDYASNLDALPAVLRAAYRDGLFDASLRDALDQCIPTTFVREAQARWTSVPPDEVPMCAMGVDPSGGGEDPMAIAIRHDGWYAPCIMIPAKKIPKIKSGSFGAGIVIQYRRNEATVVLDMGGGYGAGIYEHLHDNKVDVAVFKGAESTARRGCEGKHRFTNKRSAAYWLFREALDPGQVNGSPIALPDDPELIADLTAPTFKVTPHGIQVERKEDIVARLGRSPNKGDAVVMAWFEGPKHITHAMEWMEQGGKKRMPQVVTKRQALTAKYGRG